MTTKTRTYVRKVDPAQAPEVAEVHVATYRPTKMATRRKAVLGRITSESGEHRLVTGVKDEFSYGWEKLTVVPARPDAAGRKVDPIPASPAEPAGQ